MMEWIQSWSMINWAFAIGAFLVVLIAMAQVFGRDTLKAWVSAVWNRKSR